MEVTILTVVIDENRHCGWYPPHSVGGASLPFFGDKGSAVPFSKAEQMPVNTLVLDFS